MVLEKMIIWRIFQYKNSLSKISSVCYNSVLSIPSLKKSLFSSTSLRCNSPHMWVNLTPPQGYFRKRHNPRYSLYDDTSHPVFLHLFLQCWSSDYRITSPVRSYRLIKSFIIELTIVTRLPDINPWNIQGETRRVVHETAPLCK